MASDSPHSPVRIAVIGGGIAGITLATELAKTLDRSDPDSHTSIADSSHPKWTITIFENGRAPGGRCASRASRKETPAAAAYQFDHGNPIVPQPHSSKVGVAGDEDDDEGYVNSWSNAYAEEFRSWKYHGMVQDWKATMLVEGGDENVRLGYWQRTVSLADSVRKPLQVIDKSYTVSCPKGNSLPGAILEKCQQSLGSAVSFRLVCGRRVVPLIRAATNGSGKTTWRIFEFEVGTFVGEFDWLISGDRNFVKMPGAIERMSILDQFALDRCGRKAALPGLDPSERIDDDFVVTRTAIRPFIELTDQIQSAALLVLMIAFEKRIPGFDPTLSAIQFVSHPVLQMVIVDSNKRARPDSASTRATDKDGNSKSGETVNGIQKESSTGPTTQCWTLYATYEASSQMLAEANRPWSPGSSSDCISEESQVDKLQTQLEEQKRLAEVRIYGAFLALLQEFGIEKKDLPPTVYKKAHRWGAAFPTRKPPPSATPPDPDQPKEVVMPDLSEPFLMPNNWVVLSLLKC